MTSKSNDPILDSDLHSNKKLAHLMLKDLGSDKLIVMLLADQNRGRSVNVINLFKAYLMHALDRELTNSGLVKT